MLPCYEFSFFLINKTIMRLFRFQPGLDWIGLNIGLRIGLDWTENNKVNYKISRANLSYHTQLGN